MTLTPSLRFIAILLGLATAGAGVALVVLDQQAEQQARVTAEALTGGRVDEGKAKIVSLGCGACHVIPGVPGVQGKVGPSLKGFASHSQIAGKLSNQPEALVHWLRVPQTVWPGNGMPDQNLGEADARDLAAFLYTLRSDSR